MRVDCVHIMHTMQALQGIPWNVHQEVHKPCNYWIIYLHFRLVAFSIESLETARWPERGKHTHSVLHSVL